MRKLLSLFLFIATLPAQAAFGPETELTPFRVGILGGAVQMYGDPGAKGEGSWGLGVSFSYTWDPLVEVEVRYVGSNTGNVDHSEVSFSGLYTLPIELPESMRSYAIFGVSFLSNDFVDPNLNGDGFGLSIGAGLEYYFSRQFSVGPEARFQLGYGSDSRVPGTTRDIELIDNGATILMRANYSIGVFD